MTDSFVFSSDGYSPEAGFEAYRRLYAGGSDVSRSAAPFAAHVMGVRLDGMLLFERRLNGVIHSRSRRVLQDGFDHFALHLVLSGRMKGGRHGAFAAVEPLDMVMVDTLKPSWSEAIDLHVLTASVPRETLVAACGDLDGLHGRIVKAPNTFVLRDLMLSLVRNAAVIDARAIPGLRRAMVELLAGVLDPGDNALTTAARLDLTRRESAVRFILANLGNRALDADTVALGVGLSRSMLYRLFAAQGGVAQVIMNRRLSTVRDKLESGSNEPLAALATAHGFADESHLNRRFNRAYGQPAGAFRRLVTSGGEDTATTGARLWDGWMQEVA